MVLVFGLLSFRSDNNLVDWDASRKLTWSDFKAAPDPSSGTAALTYSSINVEFGYNNSGLTHSIKCRFNKSLSWGRIKNDYILKHEQDHFDLAEVHARMLHKAMQEYSFNSKTVSADLNTIYNAVMKKHVSAQQEFDQQTNHSLIAEKQKEWDKKIDSLLKTYQAYANYR